MKEPNKKIRAGGGAKSKTARAKAESRKMATAKKSHAAAAGASEVETALRKTRTKAAREKTRRVDIEPVLSAEISSSRILPRRFPEDAFHV